MSQPANLPATLDYQDPDAATGEVVGALRILDQEQETVTERAMVSGPVELSLPGPGWYFVHGRLASGGRLSESFQVRPAPASPPQVVMRPTPRRHAEPIPLDGWIAGWRSETTGFVPAAQLSTVEGGLLAAASDGGNMLAQVATSDQAPSFTVLTPGLPMRIVPQDAAPGYRLVPGEGLAATMLAFLHAGDLASARAVTPQPLPPPDSGLALMVGYQFARCHDERLDEWTRALVAARPDSFDAHLLRGYALLSQGSGIAAASAAFVEAARHGLPVVSSGLRLFDHGLRLLSQGRDRPDLEELRHLHMRYLRGVFDTGVTSFWGADPNDPTVAPSAAAARTHADRLRLLPEGAGWRAAMVPRSGATPWIEHLRESVRRLGRDLFAVHTVRISMADVHRDPSGHSTAATFDLPPDLEPLLGGAVQGMVRRAGDTLLITLANVRPETPEGTELAITVGDASEPVQLRRRTSAALSARTPWTGPDLPDRIDILLLGPSR